MKPGLLPHSYIKDSSEMKPGLLPHMIDMFSDNDQQKSFKRCVDSKKLNKSSRSLSGSVNLFGFEDKPTAKDVTARLSKGESVECQIHTIFKMFYEMELTDMHVCLIKCPKECRELLHLMKEVSAVELTPFKWMRLWMTV